MSRLIQVDVHDVLVFMLVLLCYGQLPVSVNSGLLYCILEYIAAIIYCILDSTVNLQNLKFENAIGGAYERDIGGAYCRGIGGALLNICEAHMLCASYILHMRGAY